CVALKPGAVRTTERDACTASVALRTVRLAADDAAFADHLTGLRILVNAANDSTYRPSSAGPKDYDVVLRDRCEGESMTDAAKRLTALTRYSQPTSGKFDVPAAFSAVRDLPGAGPAERQAVLENWQREPWPMPNRRRDQAEAQPKFLPAKQL